MFSEGILGLFRKRDAIHQEQHAGDGVGFEQSLDKCSCGAGLARAGCHFDQQLAAALQNFFAQNLNAGQLVIAASNSRVCFHAQQVALHLSCGEAAFQIILLEEGFYRMRISGALPFPETHFVTVGEEDVGDV